MERTPIDLSRSIQQYKRAKLPIHQNPPRSFFHCVTASTIMTPDSANIKAELDQNPGGLSGNTPAINNTMASDFANIKTEFDEHSNALIGNTPTSNDTTVSDLDNMKTEFDEHYGALAGSSPTFDDAMTPDFWDVGAEMDDHCSGLSGDTLTCSSIMTPEPADIVDANTVNTLFHAVLSGDANEVRALSSGGMYISPLDSWIIFEACLQGPDMIQAFCSNPWLDLGQPLASPTGSPVISYLLHTTASRFPQGKRDTIFAVLQQAISPIAYDHHGNHALHVLAESSDAEASDLMKLFLSQADGVSEAIRAASLVHINSRNWPILGNEFGNTPLTLAVLKNNTECVRVLLENGADPVCPGQFDQTPLQLAVIRGHWEIVCMLLNCSYL